MLDNSSIRSLLLKRGVKLRTKSEIYRKYSLNQNYFDCIDTEAKAYYLGLLYADGYNNEKGGEIHLSLQEEDKLILEKFLKELKSNQTLIFLNLQEKNKNRKNIYRLSISSKQISKRLRE